MVRGLSRSLVDLGHEVEVVTLDPSMTLPRSELTDGVKVKRFGCFAPSNAYFFPSPSALEYIATAEHDIVHSHNIGSLLVPGTWLSRKITRGNAGMVVSPHHHSAGSLWHTRLFWAPYRPLARRVLRDCAVVHCVSRFEASLVTRDFGVDSTVIGNGVENDVANLVWNPPAGELNLTYCGRVETYKKVDRIIVAASVLQSEGEKVRITLVGEGPDVKRLDALARKLGVEMTLHGFLPRRDYLDTIANSSCLVNVSEYEAFSIVTAEALAMGVPVVVSRGWGATFAPSPKLFVVPNDSPRSIAAAAVSSRGLRNGRSQFQTWGEVARRVVEEVYLKSFGKDKPAS